MDAARSYNSMGERERHAYWNQLTPEQQAALTEALAAVALEAQPKAVAAVNPEPRRRRGTFAVGCFGVILGVILTLAVEVVAVATGISALADIFSSPSSSPSSSTSQSVPRQDESQANPAPDRDTPGEDDSLDCRNPRNASQRRECSQQRYKEQKEKWESRHPGEEYPCEAPLLF
jgi:cytoskeletal protein RodZ